MASNQSVLSPLKNLSVVDKHERKKSDFVIENSGSVSVGNGFHRKETVLENSGGYIGVLEVYIHQARDIHNICIYNKQDVYAKLCLTSDPETTFSSQIINGGGKNPIFNENLRLNVQTLDSSLKCEVWMLSRVKNYLEDQLLGFALVPLSDLFVGNGKLEQEFSLSANDLFHSPAGFVQLSISYYGASPEVLAIPTPRAVKIALQDSEISDTVSSDYGKIEFPDPDIANENDLMVSQYFGMPCTTLDSQSSESLLTSDSDNHLTSGQGVNVVESFSEASPNFIEVTKNDTPASSVSTNGSPSPSIPASSQSFCDTPRASKSSNQELLSPLKEENADIAKEKSNTSNGIASNNSAHSVVGVNIVPEKTVVQQEIVDMYMKSMQQFTESLAKMKLPIDIENGTNDPGNANGSSDQKLQTPKSTGSRVFYGSRAFF